MRIRILGALVTLVTCAGWAAAGSGSFGSCSVFDKWKNRCCPGCVTPCEPCCVPTFPIPPPTVFPGEVGHPVYVEGKKLPPIQLVRAVPPPVELVNARPPHVVLVRATPPPVELVTATPPNVERFHRQPLPLKSAPPVCFPSVKLFHIEQPPMPCAPPPVCAPCANVCGH